MQMRYYEWIGYENYNKQKINKHKKLPNDNQISDNFRYYSLQFDWNYYTVRPIKKETPVNQINFSGKYNDLSKKVYIVTKFSLSSFFWHQIKDILAMHGRAQTISNGDVKIDLRRIGG